MRQSIQSVEQQRLLHLPPEVRLIIYRFLLVHDTPISLTKYFALDSSLVRTCSLFRQEGIPIFFGRNNFILQPTTSKVGKRLIKRFAEYEGSIRNMTIDFQFEGQSHI